MENNIFELVKERITPKAAAARYGIEVNKGFCHCPFHEDKTPSMKLYQDHYYCFGCGAHGDTVKFVSQILGLSQIETARKIVSDFSVSAPEAAPSAPAAEKQQSSKAAEEGDRYVLRSWFISLVRANSVLNAWKSRYEAKADVSLEESDPRYIYALKYQSDIEYRLDVLTEKKDDIKAAYETLRSWLKHTSAGKMQEYRLIADGHLDNDKEISILI